jgi:hypothetical protein
VRKDERALPKIYNLLARRAATVATYMETENVGASFDGFGEGYEWLGYVKAKR